MGCTRDVGTSSTRLRRYVNKTEVLGGLNTIRMKNNKSKCSYCCSNEEAWRPIRLYPGYIVSSKGKVKSYKVSKQGRILKTPTNGRGYEYVGLIDLEHKVHYKRVHVLVAEAFLQGKLDDSYIVNHIDGNPTHNCIENLEWCTSVKNTHHAVENGLFKNLDIVFQMDDKHKIIGVFHSAREAGRILEIDSSSISKCIKHNAEHKHVGGYKWVSVKEIIGKSLKVGDD